MLVTYRIALWAVAWVLVSQGPAAATTIYTYTGNPFTVITDSPGIPGSFTTSDSISGSFSVAAPVAPGSGSVLTNVVSSYQFSNGRTQFNETNSRLDSLSISTDAAGQVSAWGFVFSAGYLDAGGIRVAVSDLGEDLGGIIQPLAQDVGSVSDQPGTWAITTVPEPRASAFALVSILLVAFGSRAGAAGRCGPLSSQHPIH